MSTRRFVVATAGHVDHGKSTLVRALTGMEPDRFAEEQRRGMTIDLGFAWTDLASDLPTGADSAHVAFVDVPGHERFIATMLAGLGPSPAVLFVVAADDGWSAQSAEHLAAADALRVRHGLLAVTRSDLADPEPARRDALDRIARSSLGVAESVVVSGATGAGLPDLRTGLGRMLATLPRPDAQAPVRLWLDRSFSVRGSGTVVTGTLSAGTVRIGDTLTLGERTVTVRRVQSAGQPHDQLGGVSRIALNLRGIDAEDAHRGDVLLTPDAWWTTATVDARLSTIDRLPTHGVLHVGSAAVPVRVRPLDPDDEPRSDRHVRLTLERPLPLRAGDRAVLRDPGRHPLAAAVLVLDADPPVLLRRGAGRRRAHALADVTDPDGRPDAATEIARRGAVRRTHLDRLGVDTSGHHDTAGWLVDTATMADWTQRAAGVVGEWARTHPLDPPMPTNALAHALSAPRDSELMTAIADAAGLHVGGGKVTTGEIRGDLGPAQRGVDTLVGRLREHPFRAPDVGELADLGLGRRELAAAERIGLLIRIPTGSSEIVLLPDAADRAVATLRGIASPFTLSAARQALDTTRRVAVPLLEHLDQLGRTRFVDDNRRILTGT